MTTPPRPPCDRLRQHPLFECTDPRDQRLASPPKRDRNGANAAIQRLQFAELRSQFRQSRPNVCVDERSRHCRPRTSARHNDATTLPSTESGRVNARATAECADYSARDRNDAGGATLSGFSEAEGRGGSGRRERKRLPGNDSQRRRSHVSRRARNRSEPARRPTVPELLSPG